MTAKAIAVALMQRLPMYAKALLSTTTYSSFFFIWGTFYSPFLLGLI